MFKRKPIPPRKLTGVGAILSASHRDQTTGQVHGHTWEITAWFLYSGAVDARVRQRQLNEVIERLDHTCLPDRIAWGEALAEHVAATMPHGWDRGDPDCVAVDVSRPLERIYARWEA